MDIHEVQMNYIVNFTAVLVAIYNYLPSVSTFVCSEEVNTWNEIMICSINMTSNNKSAIVVWLKKNRALGIRCFQLKESVVVSDPSKLKA